jgi:hypothetical protein
MVSRPLLDPTCERLEGERVCLPGASFLPFVALPAKILKMILDVFSGIFL